MHFSIAFPLCLYLKTSNLECDQETLYLAMLLKKIKTPLEHSSFHGMIANVSHKIFGWTSKLKIWLNHISAPNIVLTLTTERVVGLIQFAQTSSSQGSEVLDLCPVCCEIANTFMSVCLSNFIML